MRTGDSSSEKQPAFELGWGLFASSLTRRFSRPICSLWRPVHGPPLAGTPAYPIPHPQGSLQPSSPTSSPIHFLRQGPDLRLVTAVTPLSNTRDFSRSHPLLSTRAQGTRHPLAQPHLQQGLDPIPIFAGHSRPLISLHGPRVDYPLPFTPHLAHP